MIQVILLLGFSLFLIIIELAIIFIIFGQSSTYVSLTSSRGFILSLFQIAHLPVRIFNLITSRKVYTPWDIETNPPSWLPPQVIAFKNKLTWKDRAFFWHLLLRSGTKTVHREISTRFLPQVIAHSFFIITKKIIGRLIHPFSSFRRFVQHPIKAYLELTGSFSGSVINWICSMPYNKLFIEKTRKAGFPIGYYYGKQYLKNPIFSEVKYDALKAMQFIMVVYVLFGLAGWERHIYPRNQPRVTIHSENEVVITFSGIPYKCPHRGLKCARICQSFVSWEDGLVQAVNPNLTSYVTKSLANGDKVCEVIITKKKEKSRIKNSIKSGIN